ncbi:MAG: tripartite tricarboxylate transporter TctB family protein [Thermodesulfobacteriota bacterium]|nr:tripartite tricarboxylate transporter TctB family protein [Thermodesulfobacteriota bacterium]
MREHKVVAPILFGLAFLGIWDGVRIIIKYKNEIGGREAGGCLVLLGLFMICLTTVYWFQTCKNRIGGKGDAEGGNRWIVSTLALLAGYAILINFLGYLLSTAVFLVLYLRIFGAYRWLPIVIGSLIGAVGSAYIWAKVGLMLPGGFLPWP